MVGTQQFIFLSFRAAFVQSLSDGFDVVYLGLQRTGGAQAMVVRIQAHDATTTPAGPPSANPPLNINSVQISTRTGTSWTVQGMNPTWIAANARAWRQSAGDVPADPNNRWAVQLRIPVTTAIDITDNAGPNLGTDFIMWYAIEGATSIGDAVILADYRTSGTTTPLDLVTGNYPAPSVWDQFLLTSGPASFGGVALHWDDVLVQNVLHGTGTEIANHALNTFIARPRNYRPAGNDIPAGAINATFRIANWGSVAGDPHQIDFGTGVWDYVPGNSAVTPVNSSMVIPTLAAADPVPTTNPIALPATMNLGAGKSFHQCVLVTLSGANLNFLNDSIYRNMNYDGASLIERAAEISVVGLTPVSEQPRDVFLAVEKVNMLRDTPGANEGQFLSATMDRLIAQGGPLAEKLQAVRSQLFGDGEGGGGDFGSAAALDSILTVLRELLAGLRYRESEGEGESPLDAFIDGLRRWLLSVKANVSSAQRLAVLVDALADWLLAGADTADARLATFVTQAATWVRGLANDPAANELLPSLMRLLFGWVDSLVDNEKLLAALQVVASWVDAGVPADQQPAVANALREFMSILATGNTGFTTALGNIWRSIARWLRGAERLETFVDAVGEGGLTDDEKDRLFPTIRVHPYHDTGARIDGADGRQHRVLRSQSAFGIYAYHEGAIDGWQTSLQGAQRIAENLYLLAVPNNGTAQVTVRVQAVEPGDRRIPDDPIVPLPPLPETGGQKPGCLGQILKLFGIGR